MWCGTVRAASFVPVTVRRFLQENAHLDDNAFKAPMRQEFRTVALFADVSGFKELSEALAAKGPIGSEELGYYLNKHLELMGEIIGKSGGDVFKFAGDAMVWSSEQCRAISRGSPRSPSTDPFHCARVCPCASLHCTAARAVGSTRSER